ncbi:MAG: hypothetical protein WKF47_12435 [Geodermatophilaceae bacterium]
MVGEPWRSTSRACGSWSIISAEIEADAWPVWGSVLLGLSRRPNVYIKLSALGHLSV